MKPLLIFGAIAVALSGCGTTPNATAQIDIPRDVCLADMQDEPFVNIGNGL